MRKIGLFLFLISLYSCNYNRNKSENLNLSRIDIIKDSIAKLKTPARETETRFLFLNKYKFKDTPLKDTTNFDNFKSNNLLSKEQIKTLQLNKKIKEGERFIINYRLKLSDKFHTIVITYQLGDNQLYTVLFNYDLNYKIIDCVDIAFDEIAESFLRKESDISKSEIKIKDIDSSSGEPQIKLIVCKIQENGKLLILK